MAGGRADASRPCSPRTRPAGFLNLGIAAAAQLDAATTLEAHERGSRLARSLGDDRSAARLALELAVDMRFLVISTPVHQVPLEHLPGLLTAEREWCDRNREYLEAYGWFADKGGFGLVDVPDLETLSRVNKEHPFAYNSDTQIRAVVDADVAVQQVRALLEQQGIPVPA